MNGQANTQIFSLTGMTCASCASNIEKHLNKQQGVDHATVNFANAEASVTFTKSKIDFATIKKAVNEIGYDILANQQSEQNLTSEQNEEVFVRLKKDTITVGILSCPLMIIGMIWPHWQWGEILSAFLAAPVVFYFGSSFFIKARKQLKNKIFSMDTLIAISTSVAYFFSLLNLLIPGFFHSHNFETHIYFETSAIIIFFVLLGKLLEGGAKVKTNSALKRLMELAPKTVIKIVKGTHEQVKPSQLQIGDHILIKPGDKIPVDGQVIEGNSFIDESSVSGEHTPTEKHPSDLVTSGTINQTGSLIIEAKKVGAETFVNQMIRAVRTAQNSKAPVQRIADKVASFFVPAVLAASFLCFSVWMILGGIDAFPHALVSSISILVIACPCALGLATPTAIMVGIGNATENGILVKNAASLEVASKIDTIIFDKTGTITEGKPMVRQQIWLKEDFKLKEFLLSIERQSEHPIARALTSHMEKEASNDTRPQHFTAIPGKGVMATVANKNYFIGNRRMLEELKIPQDKNVSKTTDLWTQEGLSSVFFFSRKELIAAFGIGDQLKHSAGKQIERLASKGKNIYMLSGDQKEVVQKIANSVGITEYQAQMMPQDKADFIKSLQNKGHKVAMVGDGINDSPAIAQSDLSIAMGQGADITMDLADATVISSELSKINDLLELSSRTRNILRQNLFWAFGFNIIGIPIAAGVLYPSLGLLLNPMLASAAMAFSSVAVVSNSLRLKKTK